MRWQNSITLKFLLYGDFSGGLETMFNLTGLSVTPGISLESVAKEGGSSLASSGSLSPSLPSSSSFSPVLSYEEFNPENRGVLELNNDEPGF
jgi:hypothetical protein